MFRQRTKAKFIFGGVLIAVIFTGIMEACGGGKVEKEETSTSIEASAVEEQGTKPIEESGSNTIDENEIVSELSSDVYDGKYQVGDTVDMLYGENGKFTLTVIRAEDVVETIYYNHVLAVEFKIVNTGEESVPASSDMFSFYADNNPVDNFYWTDNKGWLSHCDLSNGREATGIAFAKVDPSSVNSTIEMELGPVVFVVYDREKAEDEELPSEYDGNLKEETYYGELGNSMMTIVWNGSGDQNNLGEVNVYIDSEADNYGDCYFAGTLSWNGENYDLNCSDYDNVKISIDSSEEDVSVATFTVDGDVVETFYCTVE